ncbi:MAG: hypothetical protein AAF725_19295 [Acidobacteriota bacterium]
MRTIATTFLILTLLMAPAAYGQNEAQGPGAASSVLSWFDSLWQSFTAWLPGGSELEEPEPGEDAPDGPIATYPLIDPSG